MINRYLVFAGNVFYPHGGMQDLHSSHNELADAVRSAETYELPEWDWGGKSKWAEVFDTHEMKIVQRFHDARLGEHEDFGRNRD